MVYKKRYERESEQIAYENACDCIYFGYGKSHWNSCGLSEKRSEAVWKKAMDDMSNSL